MPSNQYEYLDPAFLEALNELARLGFEKHGANSYHARRMAGDRTRSECMTVAEIMRHSKEHFEAYARGEKHDRLYTLKHQLAAVALNPMIEFFYANLQEEIPDGQSEQA